MKLMDVMVLSCKLVLQMNVEQRDELEKDAYCRLLINHSFGSILYLNFDFF